MIWMSFKKKNGEPLNPKDLNKCRIVFSYIIFVLLLLFSSLITMALVTIQANQDASVNYTETAQDLNISIADPTVFSNSTSIVWSLAITGAIALINFLCGKLFTQFLTNFEQHYTWTSYKTHHLTKYFLFRILNLSIVFLMRCLVENQADVLFAYFPFYSKLANERIKDLARCGVSRDAEQFFFLLVVDYTAIRFITIFVYWFQYAFYYCCHRELDKKKKWQGKAWFWSCWRIFGTSLSSVYYLSFNTYISFRFCSGAFRRNIWISHW